jgi:arsenate reductase-like glutaredoxin family protein
MVDHIGAFENIQDEFKDICKSLGINTVKELKHENKTNYKNLTINYKDIYNQECIDIVAEKDKAIIDMKGYDFF